MAVIDFHSHILPGIDDGSRNIDTSVRMLEASAAQGVELMAATSHFYASRDRIGDFLARRQDAYEALCAALPGKKVPKIRLGAEVAFFSGISRADKIQALTLQGTRLLLLELPFYPWDASVVEEVDSLIADRGFTILLAHLERYLGFRENKKYIKELLEMPLYVQINAESFNNWKLRRRLLKMFKKGEAHVLGSDCHGIHHRVPNLAEGRKALREKLGEDFLQEVDRLGTRLILEDHYV